MNSRVEIQLEDFPIKVTRRIDGEVVLEVTIGPAEPGGLHEAYVFWLPENGTLVLEGKKQ